MLVLYVDQKTLLNKNLQNLHFPMNLTSHYVEVLILQPSVNF
jgi:hypothetical protein